MGKLTVLPWNVCTINTSHNTKTAKPKNGIMTKPISGIKPIIIKARCREPKSTKLCRAWYFTVLLPLFKSSSIRPLIQPMTYAKAASVFSGKPVTVVGSCIPSAIKCDKGAGINTTIGCPASIWSYIYNFKNVDDSLIITYLQFQFLFLHLFSIQN